MAIKNSVEFAQNVLNLLKSCVVPLLFVTILIWPGTFEWILSRFGIHEWEFGGFKGKTTLIDVAQRLRDQEDISRDLTTRLETARALLARAGDERPSGSPPPNSSTGYPEEIRKFLAATQLALARSSSTQEATSATLTMVAPAVIAAQSALHGAGGWAIVFSGDTTSADADKELEAVRQLGIGSPQLYLRQKWYRGIVTFATQTAAQRNLAKVQNLGGHFKNAYVVNLSSWCPVAVQTSPTVTECRG